jgi:putative ABC transport system permease protein
MTNYQVISAGYFRTLGLTMRQGRELTEENRQGRTRAVVINQRLAEKFFPDGNPIGERLLISEHVEGRDDPRDLVTLEIVGIVNDLKSSRLNEPSHPQIYVSYLQAPVSNEYLVIRSGVERQMLLDSLHRAVRVLDPDLPLTDVSTMDERLTRSLVGGRVVVILLVIFAFLALSMGSAGLYGVISDAAGQRTTEFALRLALGAPRREIFRLIANGAVRLLLIGGGIGIALALGVTRVLRSMIFGVSPHDPLTIVVVVLVLLVVVLAASYLPARRAMEVDPMVALRNE